MAGSPRCAKLAELRTSKAACTSTNYSKAAPHSPKARARWGSAPQPSENRGKGQAGNDRPDGWGARACPGP